MPLRRPLVVREPSVDRTDRVTLRGLSAAEREQGQWTLPTPVNVAMELTGGRIEATPAFTAPPT